ncbi:MAG: histidinol-phosphatase [Ignavibacteria bacterium GWA2_35_9]|nr:MAG: histidinol-phosphatase [Ignavibacteria bacterium GWA2_35_9]
MSISELNDLKIFSKYLADKSGDIIKNYFRTDLNVESKPDLSPVTIADKKSEEKMREIIMKEFPDHGIIGEEFGSYNNNAEYKWVIDPIDGTKSFICGAISFGTLIALTKKGEPILGVINQPVLNEFLIGDNNTAELNGRKVKTRFCNAIENSVLVTADHLNIGKYQDIKKFEELIKKVKLYRGWGDCYGYYLLATGYIDIMIDPIMNVWDTMALVPVVRGAGGVITDYQGKDVLKGDSVIAASQEIHAEVIRLLN